MKKQFWIYKLSLDKQKRLPNTRITGADWHLYGTAETRADAEVVVREVVVAGSKWKYWKIEEVCEFLPVEPCAFCGKPKAEHTTSSQTCGAYQEVFKLKTAFDLYASSPG